MSLTIPERLARLAHAHAENRIIRGAWTKGAELACLLSWYSPESRDAHDAGACPADALPPWLAYLAVWINDAPSDTAWPGLIARYVRVLHRLHEIAPERLTWLDYECRAIAVREARSHTEDPPALVAIDGVLVLLDRAAAGGTVQRMAWDAAARAAAGAGAAAWDAAARAAAWAAARAAAWAAAWDAAAAAPDVAGETAAADRMADAMLTAFEHVIGEGQDISTC